MAEITAGPWTVGPTGDYEESWIYGGDGTLIADCAIGVRDEQTEANAKAIASLPDLIAACVFFEEWDNYGLDKGISLRDVREQIHAALAKAKGA